MTAREGSRASISNETLAKMEPIARRALVCKGWRWMAGMMALSNERAVWIRVVDPPMDETSDCFPDLTDPATLGCLLVLVREAWGDLGMGCVGHFRRRQGRKIARWHFYGGKPHSREFSESVALVPYDTEMEALVAALEAAKQN